MQNWGNFFPLILHQTPVPFIDFLHFQLRHPPLRTPCRRRKCYIPLRTDEQSWTLNSCLACELQFVLVVQFSCFVICQRSPHCTRPLETSQIVLEDVFVFPYSPQAWVSHVLQYVFAGIPCHWFIP